MLDSNIFLNDIQPLNESMGLIHQVKNVRRKAPLMSGEFRFHTFAGGLSMHASHATELQDSDSALELPPGLSFNLIFGGVVDFSFGGKQYRMQHQNQADRTLASCTSIVNNRDEILTRHMAKDVQVEKLNVFVEKKWLLARCHTEAEQAEVNALLGKQGVYHWSPSQQAVKLAFNLLKIEDNGSLHENLELELHTIKLLTALIRELRQATRETRPFTIEEEKFSYHNSLKTDLDKTLSSCHTINDVAEALNMSPRTLQRKFKELYQIPASNYIKQRRMDFAKKALLLDDLSIGEASFRAGYNHPSNFVSAFKKLYGLTPTEYKKAHQFI